MSADTTVRAALAPPGPPTIGLEPGRHSRAARGLRLAGRLTAGTVRTCLRYRVTGLAAEAGFFALLSLPPLVLGMVASVGFAGHRVRADVVTALQARLEQVSGTFLTQDTVREVIAPTFAEVVRGGRLEIVSIGFLLALWSGSRALNVYVDTVSIMYGFGGHRGIVRTRLLSFTLYVLSLVLGIVVFPLVLLGPGLLSAFLAQRLAGVAVPGWLPPISWLGWCYLPVVVLASVAGLTTLYHVATPVRGRWRRDCPGAALALLMWLAASVALHGVIAAAVGGTSIYGPLAAPIVLLIWLYLLAIAVLVGAALNATLAQLHEPAARISAGGRISAGRG